MKLHRLLLFLGVLFFCVQYPVSHVFAATASIPAIGNITYTDVAGTVDTDTVVGLDAGSGTTNTAILTMETDGTALTINACGVLVVGEIKLGGTGASRAYISIQPATAYVCPATGTADSGKIILGAPVYITDADGDTYPADTTLYSATTTGRQRLATMNANWKTMADCDENDAAKYAALVCYADADSDGQYAQYNHAVCDAVSACNLLDPAESANPGTDCCDSNGNAYTGQTAYFDTPMTNSATCPITAGVNDYDYNCSGSNAFEASTIYACTNPCSGCSLDYSVTAGWLTSAPTECGGTGTYYTMSGSYVSGTCYTVASCSVLASSATTKRKCH